MKRNARTCKIWFYFSIFHFKHFHKCLNYVVSMKLIFLSLIIAAAADAFSFFEPETSNKPTGYWDDQDFSRNEDSSCGTSTSLKYLREPDCSYISRLFFWVPRMWKVVRRHQTVEGVCCLICEQHFERHLHWNHNYVQSCSDFS